MRNKKVETKVCKLCSKQKGFTITHKADMFSKDLSKKDGLRASCMLWTRKQQQERYNKAKLKETDQIKLPEEAKSWAYALCNVWLRKKSWIS